MVLDRRKQTLTCQESGSPPSAEETSARFHPQVHHLDRNPARNDRANLVCVCAGCHLRLHRHHPKPTPGQLSLARPELVA